MTTLSAGRGRDGDAERARDLGGRTIRSLTIKSCRCVLKEDEKLQVCAQPADGCRGYGRTVQHGTIESVLSLPWRYPGRGDTERDDEGDEESDFLGDMLDSSMARELKWLRWAWVVLSW